MTSASHTHPYLIQFRLCDKPRRIAKKLIFDIHEKFGIVGNILQPPVPHISLYGPFKAQSVKDVVNAIIYSAKGFESFCYNLDGFGVFDKKIGWFSKRRHAVYMKMNADHDMEKFRSRLYKNLVDVTDPMNPSFEEKDPFPFHVTLALNDIAERFDEIWKYLTNTKVSIFGKFYRITLLKNGKILYEYDLASGKILERDHALLRPC